MPEDLISKADLPEDVVDYIDGLEDSVDTLSKAVADKDTEIAELTAERDEAQATSTVVKSEEEQFEAILAKADPSVQVVLRKQAEDIKKAQEVADAERNERLNAEYVRKAAALPMIAEPQEDLAGLLRRVHDGLSPEDAAKVEKVLADANTQIAKGNLFSEFGRSGQESTVSKSVDAHAQELMKTDPSLTKEMATAKVYETNPDLFTQAMTEEN